MRTRDIKPGFYLNEDLAECSCWARLIYPGLWMLADREGRLEYRPKRIKAEILPYDGEDMAALIGELEAHGLVKRYEVDGKEYLWIPTFSRHQKPHPNEKASVLPPCLDGHGLDEQQKSPTDESASHQGDTDLPPRSEVSISKDERASHQRDSQSGLLSLSSCYLSPGENTSPPVESLVNQDRARSPERGSGGGGADLSGPGLEFVELRDFYSREIRPEGPLDGFIEYKQLKAARDPTGVSVFPGLSRILDDLAARKAAGFWNPGYGISLARYLKTHTWLAPIQSRASPPSEATPTEFQRQQQDRRNMMRIAKDLRERERAAKQQAQGVQHGQKAATATPPAAFD